MACVSRPLQRTHANENTSGRNTEPSKLTDKKLGVAYCLVKARPNASQTYEQMINATGILDFGRTRTLVMLPHLRPFSAIAPIPIIEQLRTILADEAVLLDEARSVWNLQLDSLTVLNTLSQLGFCVSQFDINSADGVHTWTLECGTGKSEERAGHTKRADVRVGQTSKADVAFKDEKRSLSVDGSEDGLQENGSNADKFINNASTTQSGLKRQKLHVQRFSGVAKNKLSKTNGTVFEAGSPAEMPAECNDDDNNSDGGVITFDEHGSDNLPQSRFKNTRNTLHKRNTNVDDEDVDVDNSPASHGSLDDNDDKDDVDYKHAGITRATMKTRKARESVNKTNADGNAKRQLASAKSSSKKQSAATVKADFDSAYAGSARKGRSDSHIKRREVEAEVVDDTDAAVIGANSSASRPSWFKGRLVRTRTRKSDAPYDLKMPFELEAAHAVIGESHEPDGCFFLMVKISIRQTRLIAIADNVVADVLQYNGKPVDLNVIEADVNTRLPRTYQFSDEFDKKFHCIAIEKIPTSDPDEALRRLKELFLQMQGIFNTDVGELQGRVQWVREIVWQQSAIDRDRMGKGVHEQLLEHDNEIALPAQYSSQNLARLHAAGRTYLSNSVGRVNVGSERTPFCINLTAFMDAFQSMRTAAVEHAPISKKAHKARRRVLSSVFFYLLRTSKSMHELMEFRWSSGGETLTVAKAIDPIYKAALIDAYSRLMGYINVYIEQRNARELDYAKLVEPFDLDSELIVRTSSSRAQAMLNDLRAKSKGKRLECYKDVTVGWNEAEEFETLCRTHSVFAMCDKNVAVPLDAMITALDSVDEALSKAVVTDEDRDRYAIAHNPYGSKSLPSHLQKHVKSKVIPKRRIEQDYDDASSGSEVST